MRTFGAALAMVLLGGPAMALGPFNVDFPVGGGGIVKPLKDWSGAFTLHGWVQTSQIGSGRVLVAGIGDRYLALEAGRPAFWTAAGAIVGGEAPRPGQWRFMAAVADRGKVRLYVDGTLIASGPTPDDGEGELRLAPRGVVGAEPFAGKIAAFGAEPRALSAEEIKRLASQRPDPGLIVFDTGAPTWPVQIHGMAGLTAPQDAWTLPTSAAAPSPPVAIAPYDGPPLAPISAKIRLAAWNQL